MRKGKFKGFMIVLAVFLAISVWMAWELLAPHTYESFGPLSLAQAKWHSPIDLPASATNIHIATFRQGAYFVQYVRFEAPLSDCESFAKPMYAPASENSADASFFSHMGQPFNPRGTFHDLSWFDIRNIKSGTLFHGTDPEQDSVFIDRDRGIFYYVNPVDAH